jgi:glucose-1-phosphate thymidylyltransferase
MWIFENKHNLKFALIMKLIILSGGSGTRLGSLTTAVNKHLLPVGTEPMIAYSAKAGKFMGFDSALYVTSASALTPMATLLTNDYNDPQPYFTIQNAPSGIAHAISLGQDYCNNGPVTVILGDNVFQGVDLEDFKVAKRAFNGGCTIWAKSVENPTDYGVYDRETSRIVEKPKDPPSSLAIVGIYMFDESVWDKIRKLEPSARGELEVAELINMYMVNGNCHLRHLKGAWEDLGRSSREYLRISAEHAGFTVL